LRSAPCERMQLTMAIKTFDFGPGERPAIFCDACGQEITDVRDGNAHWDDGPFFFSHKACCHVVDEKFDTPCCQGLDEFVWYLAHNLGVELVNTPAMVRYFSVDGGPRKASRKAKGS